MCPVEKTTMHKKLCRTCRGRHDCKEVYHELGNIGGPSVVYRVVIAFLIPIAVFIASLAAFETILATKIETGQVRTVLGFVFALAVTLGLIMTTKLINWQFGKDR
jgi:hypothetical protein